MSADKKFRVAIIGGGIGGLAFAVALARCGAAVEVDVYESAACFSEVGAGLAMWPRVLDIMRLLGLGEDLKQRMSAGDKGQKYVYRKSDEVPGYEFGISKTEMLPYHRAEFLQVLESHVPAHYNTHFGKRLVSFTETRDGPVTIYFKDGTTAECDLLVGADGIKSAVRKTLYGNFIQTKPERVAGEDLSRCIEPRWTGQTIYRGLITREALEAAYPGHSSLKRPSYYIGKDKYIITYPVSQGKVINCAALTIKPSMNNTILEGPWVTPVPQEELLAEFSNWEPQATTILDLIKNPSRWIINTVDGIPTFVSDRVALIGDAAHAMSPHQGSGAGQAVEDAVVLATLLAHKDVIHTTIPQALQVYDDVRRPFAQNILDLSYKTGMMYYMRSPRFESVTVDDSVSGKVSNYEMRALSEDIGDILRWTWTTTIQTEQDSAIQLLETRLSGET